MLKGVTIANAPILTQPLTRGFWLYHSNSQTREINISMKRNVLIAHGVVDHATCYNYGFYIACSDVDEYTHNHAHTTDAEALWTICAFIVSVQL